MASESRKRLHGAPIIWIALALISAFAAGICFAYSQNWWLLLIICSIGCGCMIFNNLTRIRKRMRYVMQATLSKDFSYKFPTDNVSTDERETNEMLNRIVEHLERLTLKSKQNEAFLARVINLTDIGLALADANGNIRMHNEAALRLLDRQALTHVCQITPQAYDELAIKKSDISVNEKSFTLLSIADISRQMQAMEVESWEKLTRVLTHEIMNSLTPIQSIAENMSGKTSTRESAEAFNTISSSSRSLMQFVKNFREFSILPQPCMRAFYLKPLLESSIKIAESYIKEKHISIKPICFPPQLMLYSDESLLSRVLINILKNAIEAHPGTIEIEAYEKADESVEIRVSNNGELISPETEEHIFTPFFTTRTNGNGIGLSLSRRIITHLGGTISLKTQPITCFSIRL